MKLLERIWWGERPGPAEALLLAPLSLGALAFGAAAAVRGALYRGGLLPAARAGVPVISVGNLAVGGAGKTPATLALASRLGARGRRVAILSRGYGASRRDARVVSDGSRLLLSAAEAGDEPVLLARRLPGAVVVCGPRRAALVPVAAALGADVLLLDDGFQHRALARDLDVVVLDAGNPFGNGRLLPRGPNREAPSALGRAGLIWLSRVDQASPERLERLRARAREATGGEPVESSHAPTDVLDGTLARSLGAGVLRGEKVLALSGLARPGGFHRTLADLGAEVAAARAFPDHHRFTGAELDEALRAAAAAGCAAVVTTEKDAVRLPPARAEDPRLRVVRIEARVVRGAEALDAALEGALRVAAAPAPVAGLRQAEREPTAPPAPGP